MFAKARSHRTSSDHSCTRLVSAIVLLSALSIGLALSPAGASASSRAVARSASATRSILLTGFEPFGGQPINPSWEAVRRLNGTMIDGAVVRAEELPVLWYGSAELDRRYIDRFNPILVINVGEGGPILSLERYAHNYNDPITDNAGRYPASSVITQHGPSRYATRLNLPRIAQVLSARGLANSISEDAGGYLCNFISYHTYAYLAGTHPGVLALFVHVPPVASAQDTGQILTIERSLQVILQASMDQALAQHS